MKHMSVKEAAEYLGVSREYIRWLVWKDKIKRSQLIDDRTYLLDRASVVALDQMRRQKKEKKNKEAK